MYDVNVAVACSAFYSANLICNRKVASSILFSEASIDIRRELLLVLHLVTLPRAQSWPSVDQMELDARILLSRPTPSFIVKPKIASTLPRTTDI